mmetsp:Transcript_29132/g.68180  ORF Transcript_29132/g.68180 Transcript_29132/m.68180 type:complete len:187 (-) Transcript_29132:155-715(-)|eukprot:CAMPEP_0119362520 /NCGR_PEP_ID=MMETSP1334-20130426/9562_1 /TAXON_ID=127549 /ORGANISM="Calcidiscus leptoporus, Strain RCC1130" /LENGTH=186 /DNA_ID=CAMNT_0007377741 /DNA_START=1 /DNA_END=561 /DNA_ORIENTATION=+
MTAAAVRAAPPLVLQPGYANENGQAMHPPAAGMLEIVNKSVRHGEIIGVLAATNAVELVRGHDVMNYLPLHLGQGLMPDHTVMHAPFPTDLEVLEIVLFFGAKSSSVDVLKEGSVKENFHHAKGYRVHCRGRNILLKYKSGNLEPQRGASSVSVLGAQLGARKALGSGIDMKTNVTTMEQIELLMQ